MLDLGHDIDSTDGYGQTALMRAAHDGQHDLAKWLVARGANLDQRSKFNLTALMLAVIAGHQHIARTLIASGADATITGSGAPGFQGRTAADLALERGDRRLAAFIKMRRSQ
jgi:ankyrin repeat protein